MSTLNAITSGAGGVALSGDTSGNLIIQSAGTNVASFTTTGRLGVGTTAPGAPLDVVGTIKSSTYSQYGSSMYYGIGNALSGSYSSTDLLIYNGANGILGFVNNNTEVMRIDSSSNFFFACTSNATSKSAGVSFNQYSGGTYQIIGHGASSATTDAFLQFFVTGTSCGIITQQNGFTVNYGTSSDYRLKENIAPITGALEKVAQLKPVTYKWKTDGSDGEGFIAHELQEICPVAVAGQKDAINEDETIKPQQVDPSKLVGLLTAAIQELNAKVDAQAAEIAALKGAK